LLVARDDAWHLQHHHPDRELLVSRLAHAHTILARSGHEFGHRVMYESLRFAAILSEAGIVDGDTALDLIAMEKLLPRLHGSRRRLDRTLRGLLEWTVHPDRSPPETPSDVGDDAVHKMPATADKLRRMIETLHANQFVSFTE
jgi:5-methylcytosine-specific restriction protein B